MVPFHQVLYRLLFASVLGALIGTERDLRRRPAGIRTSMFICLATALFTILSNQLSNLWGDASATRIASNIVQGVGFLGAGAILKNASGLVGMTTAATIFVQAAIGMASGGGDYAVAGFATAMVLFALEGIAWVTDKLNLKFRVAVFRFTTTHSDNVAQEVQQLLAGLKIGVRRFKSSMAGASSVVEFEAEVSHKQEMAIVSQLNREGVVMEMLPSNDHFE